MKKLLLSLAAAALVIAACDKPKTVHIADFTASYPSSFEIMHQEDNFPNSAALYLQSADGEQLAMNSIVYYSDAELEYLDEAYEGIEHFLENKIIELFDHLDRGELLPGFAVEDIDDEVKSDDNGVGRLYCNGTYGDDNMPWKGGIIIFLNNGALVKQLAIADTDAQVNALFKIAQDIEFDPHEGSYETDESIAE